MMVDFSPDPFANVNSLRAEYERAERDCRVLSKQLDKALLDHTVSADDFARINEQRLRLLNRMKSLQLRLSALGYG